MSVVLEKYLSELPRGRNGPLISASWGHGASLCSSCRVKVGGNTLTRTLTEILGPPLIWINGQYPEEHTVPVCDAPLGVTRCLNRLEAAVAFPVASFFDARLATYPATPPLDDYVRRYPGQARADARGWAF